MKNIITIILIAGLFVLGGCASSTKIYNSEGKIVSEISDDAKMMEVAQNMSAECNKAKIRTADAAILGLNAMEISKLSKEAQAEYMRSLPMMQMAQMMTVMMKQENTDECQSGLTAYYNYKGIQKKSNSALWSKGLGIAGILGGIWATGNVLETVLDSAGPHITNPQEQFIMGNGEINTAEPYIVEIPVLPEGEIPVPLPE